jgi:FlaA1/EpsC-like NDP-sugar epimerase
MSLYLRSREAVKIRTYQKLEKLRAIGDRPVIIWGCGDLCLHMLTKVKLNVVYYVDNDPAFKGATIDGVHVFGSVLLNFETGKYDPYPIVIIAQNQASGILKRISELGLRNEVIVV